MLLLLFFFSYSPCFTLSGVSIHDSLILCFVELLSLVKIFIWNAYFASIKKNVKFIFMFKRKCVCCLYRAKKVVVQGTNMAHLLELQALAMSLSLPTYLVQDVGLTQVRGNRPFSELFLRGKTRRHLQSFPKYCQTIWKSEVLPPPPCNHFGRSMYSSPQKKTQLFDQLWFVPPVKHVFFN